MTNSDTALAVEGLRKVFRDGDRTVAAIDLVEFTVGTGDFFTLLGPSGCGKTTTLRCVAGLERATGGRITVAGHAVSDADATLFVPPHRRDVGMVFQSYGIWPHMTVFENAAFPLRVAKRKYGKREIQSRVEEALATVQLAGYEGRNATALSGGQQQRLALARALVRRPKLLLLDEPLSNLDAKLRDAMREELSSLQRRLGLTTLYVTHDQSEALSMSTRIAVLRSGRIAQEGSPEDIYQRPVDRFVADFVGRTNFIDGEVLAVGSGTVEVATSMGAVSASATAAFRAGDPVELTIRPECVRLHADEPSRTRNVWRAEIDRVTYLGESLDCHVSVGGESLIVEQPATSRFAIGQQVWVEVQPESCVAMDARPAVAEDGEASGGPAADRADVASAAKVG